MNWSKNDYEIVLDTIRDIKIKYSSNFTAWMHEGKLHRLDGPAIIWKDGSSDWFIHGTNITKPLKQWAIDSNISLENITTEEKLLLYARFS